jgi:hypothetical protein
MLSSEKFWQLKLGLEPINPTSSSQENTAEVNRNLALAKLAQTQPDSLLNQSSKEFLKTSLFCRVSALLTKQPRFKATKPTESLLSKLQTSIYLHQSNRSNHTLSLAVKITSAAQLSPLMPATWLRNLATRKFKIVLDAIPMESTLLTKMLES